MVEDASAAAEQAARSPASRRFRRPVATRAGVFWTGVSNRRISSSSRRVRAPVVIAQQENITYKNKAADVPRWRANWVIDYAPEGSARKAGNRARVNAQLVDAVTGNDLLAENFDRTLEDVSAVQQHVTRGIVAAVDTADGTGGNGAGAPARPTTPPSSLLAGRKVCRTRVFGRAVGAGTGSDRTRCGRRSRPSCIAHGLQRPGLGQWSCHLYRWGPDPANLLGVMWSAVEHMLAIDDLGRSAR